MVADKNLIIKPLTKKLNKPLNKSFAGSRGGFSKEPLAAGGPHAGGPYTRSWDFALLKYHFKSKSVNVSRGGC